MVDVERIRAIGNWAFVKVLPRKDKKAGIILPESKEEKVGYCLARILSLGPGKFNPTTRKRVRDPGVQPGDTVYVRKYLTEVNPASSIGNSEFCFLDQGDLIAVTEESVDISVIRI